MIVSPFLLCSSVIIYIFTPRHLWTRNLNNILVRTTLRTNANSVFQGRVLSILIKIVLLVRMLMMDGPINLRGRRRLAILLERFDLTIQLLYRRNLESRLRQTENLRFKLTTHIKK